MERQRTPRKRRRSSLGLFVRLLLIFTILFIAIFAFFRANHIDIIGDSRYTDEQVLVAAGLEGTSPHLLWINETEIRANIREALPYVESVSVTRRLPNRVQIEISESRAIAVVESAGNFARLDHRARVLELGDGVHPNESGIVRLTGIALLPTAQVGNTLPLTDSSIELDTLQEMLTLFQFLGLERHITQIDLSQQSNITFRAGDSLRVYLGDGAIIKGQLEKLPQLYEILQTMSEFDVGVIDMRGEPIVFRPD